MDLLLSWINASACGLISLALLYLILSPRVRDGVVIKVGLISMAAGFGAISLRFFDGAQPADVIGLSRAILLITSGIAVVIVGYLMRTARTGNQQRRTTDWADFDAEDTRPMETKHAR